MMKGHNSHKCSHSPLTGVCVKLKNLPKAGQSHNGYFVHLYRLFFFNYRVLYVNNVHIYCVNKN